MNKLTFLTSVIFSLNTFSQEKLSLQEAINIALKNNYDIQLAKNIVEINASNNSYGVAGGLPQVLGTATDQEQIQNIRQETLNNQPPRIANGALGNTLNANVNGSLLLFNGMRVVATKKRLEMLETQSQQQLNAQIQNTIAQVMVSYYDIIRQQSYQKTIEKSIQASEAKLSIVENQQKVGLSNNVDLFQSQVDLNNLKQTSISQQLVSNQSQTDFYTLLNTTNSGSYIFQDSILIDKNLKIDSIMNFIEKNPEIIASEIQVKISEQLVKETAAQRYPTLRLNTGFNYSRAQSSGGFFLLNQTYGPFIGASLNVPIYNGNIFKRQQQVAKLNAISTTIQRNALQRTYQSNTAKMWQSYTSSLQQLETGLENYKIAAKLLDLVVKRFELRQATIVDMKLAQQSFENAGYLLVNLSFAAKAAEIELKRMANKLSFLY